MTRILRSIAIRFPLLLGAIVFAVALVIGQLAQREMGAILMRQARESLDTGAEQVAAMLGSTIPSARQRFMAAGSSNEIREILALLTDSAGSARLLERWRAAHPVATRLSARVLSRDGRVRAAWTSQPDATSMGWTSGKLREGTLPLDETTVGPIISIADTMPGFVVLTPVRTAAGGHLGWVEEVHVARGAGAADIRALIDVDRLVIGSRDWPVWSDFQVIVPGPQLTAPVDSLQTIASMNGTSALGLGRQVESTSWVVWVQRPEADVLAPITTFLRRMWYAVVIIGLVGGLFAWMLGHFMAARIRIVAGELDRTLIGRTQDQPDGSSPPVQPARSAEDELRLLEDSYAALESRVEQRRHLDAQLLQADKLEAVGRLAGGIAHDFNNLLTVMASYGQMVRDELPPDSPAYSDMNEVIKATERATALTRQLLAFSRQGISDARPLDVNEVVRSTDRMLARLIPSNVERVIDLADALPMVVADHNQLEQVLINLVVNAVDAMPDGGRITIRTSTAAREWLEDDPAKAAQARDCVCLTVSDTGVGMDAATIAKIFDPFFTTKALGKGTGLGLATVHGIVRAGGGRVLAYSEPGQGTTMRVYLPTSSEGEAHPARPALPITSAPIAAGTVLLAEDDPATRTVITRILESVGHRVEAFETADAALLWLDAQPASEHPMAVISDVMMPGTNGIAFLGILRERYPTLPVLLVSGYADVRDRLPEELLSRPVVLEKPFTSAALHDALRRAVQRHASSR